MNRSIGKYLGDDSCVFEQEPMARLAADEQLGAPTSRLLAVHGHVSRAAIADQPLEQRQSAVESLVMFGSYYTNRRVLVTGHTGRGAWLCFGLRSLAQGSPVRAACTDESQSPPFIQPGTFEREIM